MLTLIRAITFSSVLAAYSSASALTFTKVADTSTPIPGGSGTFSSVGRVAIENGRVAFRGFGSNQVGIYSNAGGMFETVADTNTAEPGGSGTFGGFFGPSFDGEHVAFFATTPGGAGIFSNASGTLEVVANRSTPVPGGSSNFSAFNRPSIGSGVVAFRSSGSAGEFGIYGGSAGSLVPVADLDAAIPGGSGNFTDFGHLPYVDDGRFLFLGFGESGQTGLYANDGGPSSVLYDTGTVVPEGSGTFVGFSNPSGSAGKVAFRGLDSANDIGLYSDASGALALIAGPGTAIPGGVGSFMEFGEFSLDGQYVAFLGHGSGGQQGIYVEIGGTIHKIIDLDDTLDGKSLFSFDFGTEGLSGGTLAFGATFDDGSDGIYLVAVPEPGTGLLILMGLFGLASSRHRHGRQAR